MLIARVSISKRKAQEKMNSRRIICAATLLAGSMLFGSTAQGQVQTLNFTENSSTSLTYSLNGGAPATVTSSLGNSWLFPLQSSSPVSAHGVVFWQEPDGTLNSIAVGLSGGFTILSDLTAPGVSGLPNGATDKTFMLGGKELDVTFNDNGDSATVPDTATTLPLLGLALAALGFAKRRLF
jgi:hypothetical protein